MMQAEVADRSRLDHIGHRAIQHMAELEMPVLFPQRPTVIEEE